MLKIIGNLQKKKKKTNIYYYNNLILKNYETNNSFN